jgi:flagellar hook-length control protein FliK
VNGTGGEASGNAAAAPADRSAAASAAGSTQAANDVPVRSDSKLPIAGTGVSTSGSSMTSPTTSAALDAPRPADAVHPAATPQVRSQLDALDMRQMVWQGQLWPGQHLEWTIRDPGEDPASRPDEAQPWFTGLRLRLPRLGEVIADLALVGPALRVRLAASEPEAQTAMSAGRAALADSLAQAGIDLVSFKVAGSGDD